VAKKFLSNDQLKSKCSFPLPEKVSFRDGLRGKDAILGWEYLEKLPPNLADIARCRVYRLAPKIDMKLIGKKTTDIDVLEGPIKFPSGEYDRHFYHTYGAGSYKVIIEEQGLSGVVCDIWFTLPDRDAYPPKVDDRTVCVDAPENKDYLDWRARRGDPVGIKPESEQTGEDDLFMEAGTRTSGAVSVAAEMVRGFVDMSKSQIDEANQDRRAAQEEARSARGGSADSPNLTTIAATEAIKLVSDTTREVMKNSNAPDPIALVKEVIGLIPHPPDQTGTFATILGVVKDSNQAMMTMVMNQNAELKQELNLIRAERNAPQKSFIEQAQEAKLAAEAFGFSRNGGDHTPAAPAKSVMEEWGPIIQMVIQVATPLVGMLTQKLAQQPAPGAAPNPQPATTITQPPPQQPDPNSPQAKQLAFLQRMQGPFLSHFLSPETDGFTFAQHILTEGNGGSMETPGGRAAYRDIKLNLGIMPNNTCGLDQLIRGYEPIWSKVEGDRQRYQLFLTQFFNYDEQAGTTQ
jgi:hypothetical protein